MAQTELFIFNLQMPVCLKAAPAALTILSLSSCFKYCTYFWWGGDESSLNILTDHQITACTPAAVQDIAAITSCSSSPELCLESAEDTKVPLCMSFEHREQQDSVFSALPPLLPHCILLSITRLILPGDLAHWNWILKFWSLSFSPFSFSVFLLPS